MRTKPIFNQLKPYVPGKTIDEVKEAYGLERIIKLASNENPFGFSSHVQKHLQDAVTNLEIYPDGYARKLRTKLAAELHVDETKLIFGNGSDEIMQIICRTYLEPGTNTIMATPTFPQYRHNALIEGAEVREVPLVNGYHDLDEMLSIIDEQTRVIWLCNPNNPTGNIFTQAEFDQFMKNCPEHVLVVLDEAYMEYVGTEDFPNALNSLEEYENLIITRTFSKAYGLAALRIGYGIAQESVITKLEPAREPFNTSVIAQHAAVLALEDKAFIEKTFEQNVETKQELEDFCDRLGLRYYPSETNFLLIHLPITGDEMTEHLLQNGFIVRSGEALGIPHSIRLTIGKKDHMKEVMNSMEEKLAKVENS
ncbi:histidinol-phosphate transaminase [Pontibacillus salipaludis]|uniref:Histidinol-phosphate aminotransferase n=1 Tax=Pontibacillus salipaludis TaxID=1697394 RepID=A0ABQ1PMG4_9BACI|nr:histidinol-phosphate transaminase [Pontibacillus salipaludis]GGC99524.1 histidinol-phosphate aminotransferase [Pontibacillus salipaludis]